MQKQPAQSVWQPIFQTVPDELRGVKILQTVSAKSVRMYEASRAGVKVDLVVRGVCALRPGVPGLSENIRVRSVIGRFLKHTRIFYFRNNLAHDVYLASADWMDRNFFRRIEVCFPLLDRKLKKRVIEEGLKVYLRDNCQAWDMDAEGQYIRKATRRAEMRAGYAVAGTCRAAGRVRLRASRLATVIRSALVSLGNSCVSYLTK